MGAGILEQSAIASAGLEREVASRLAKRLEGLEASVLRSVEYDLERQAVADVGALIETWISECLATVADQMPLATVQGYMRREMPDDPRVNFLAKAGINRECDYVWARPADGVRAMDGRFAEGIVIRISPISRLTEMQEPILAG